MSWIAATLGIGTVDVHLYNRVSVHQGMYADGLSSLQLPLSPAEGSEQPSGENVCSVTDASPFFVSGSVKMSYPEQFVLSQVYRKCPELNGVSP